MKIQNKDVRLAIEALELIGRTALPIPIAVRMAKLRQNLAAHSQAVETTRAALATRHKGDADELDAKHPAWEQFVEEYNELYEQEYQLDYHFVLYHRQKNGNDEYAWTDNFKKPLTDIEPNVIYGLLRITEISEEEASE